MIVHNTLAPVPRLDGARGKEEVRRPVFEPEVFRKRMYLRYCWDFRCPGNFDPNRYASGHRAATPQIKI